MYSTHSGMTWIGSCLVFYRLGMWSKFEVEVGREFCQV